MPFSRCLRNAPPGVYRYDGVVYVLPLTRPLPSSSAPDALGQSARLSAVLLCVCLLCPFTYGTCTACLYA